MTNFVPSTADLLPACNEVLTNRLCPMNYRELTSEALSVLGFKEKQVNMFRAVEDVREKLPMRKDLNIFYSGPPYYAMAKRYWFERLQMPLMNPDYIVIPGSACAGYQGAFEALMRSPHMLDKWNGNVEVRNDRRANGLVLEKHTAGFFEQQWPEFYRPPDNHTLWQRPCSHDFKLTPGKNIIEVDVAGPGEYGYNGNVKKSTDLHLLCRIAGNDVIWEGVTTGKNFNGYIVPEESLSPHKIAVWLNCHKAGFRYQEFVQACYSMAA